jgi:hypothetical protein
MAIAGAACLLAGVGFLVALLIGSTVLRAAVSVANRMVGPAKARAERADPFADWDWDGDLEDEEPRRRGGEKAIPEPGLGKGMMIASTIGVLTAAIGIVLGVFTEATAGELFDGDEETQIALLALFTLPLGYVGATLLLTAMLPTTFGRAAVVAFVYHLFALILLVVGGGTIFVLVRV